MRLTTAVRQSWAAWALAAFVIAAFADLQGPPYDGIAYGLTRTTHVLSSILVIAPLAALCAAHDGSRLRSGDWLEIPRRRTLPEIVANASWVTLTVPAATLVGVTAVRVGPRQVDWTVVAVVLLVLAAWGLAGFAAGVLLPAVIALPASVIVSYLWFALPLALEPLWLRHLNGAWYSCCAVDTQLSGAAMTAATLVAIGLIVSAALGIAMRHRRMRGSAVTAVVMVMTLVPASLLVRHLDASPTEPRTSATICQGSDPQVCLFPEQAGQIATATAVIHDAYTAWQGTLDLPGTLSSGSADPFGHLVLGEHADTLDILGSAAVAVIPDESPCPDDGAWAGGQAQDEARLWLILATGPDLDDVISRYDEASVRAASRALQRSRDASQDWFMGRLTEADRCG